MKQSILERIKESPLVFDGAMGTVIYERGVFLNTCFDSLNLTNPKLIRSIHEDYVKAGAEVLLTNTFGANRTKLGEYGLADKVTQINEAAVKLARVNEDVYVLASVGPNLKDKEILTPENINNIDECYREQFRALYHAKVDGIMFESFCDVEELIYASKIAKDFDFPVFASMTLRKELETPKGLDLVKAMIQLDNCEFIDVLGLNCSVGPHAMLSAVEKVIPYINKPLVVQPNAGYPKESNGRLIYLSTPEYFTTYCSNYIKLGVKGVGGCCGTTPAHIQDMAPTIKSLTGVKKHVDIKVQVQRNVEIIPTSEKSKFASKLHSGKKVISVEITPPRSVDLSSMLESVRRCKESGIDAINIPDGPRASARVSSMVAAMMVEREGIEPILHYCCRDRNLIGMQSDLLGGYAAGIKNYLIVTGDPPKLGNYPQATPVFDVDAVGLTKVVHNLNYGVDIAGNEINPPTAIHIGVGANPCTINPIKEMEHLRNKFFVGAEYIITQPVFDSATLKNFIERAYEHGIPIPFVAGIWPLVSLRNALFLRNEVPGVYIPDKVIERMERAKTKEDGIKIGIEIAHEIKMDIERYVQGYQISSPFGKVEVALEVCR